MGIIWINKVYSENNRSLPGGAFDLLIQFLDGSASAWRQSGREDVAIRTSWSRDPAWRSLLSRQESCFSSTWFLIYYCFRKSTLTLTLLCTVFKIGIVYYCFRNNCWRYTTLMFWRSLILNIINLFLGQCRYPLLLDERDSRCPWWRCKWGVSQPAIHRDVHTQRRSFRFLPVFSTYSGLFGTS